MGRRPRTQKPHINRPSPLNQVQARPLSTIPSDSEKASVESEVEVEEESTTLSNSEKACLETSASEAGGLVRDPEFWKRFSKAVHMSEVDLGYIEDEEKGLRGRTDSGSGVSVGRRKDEEENNWLAQQAKEKRKCRTICASITLIVVLIIVAAAVVGYYFTKVKKI